MKKKDIVLGISLIIGILSIISCNLFSIKEEKEIDILIEIESYSDITNIIFDSNTIIWCNTLYYETDCTYSVTANTITLEQENSAAIIGQKNLYYYL